MLTTEIVKQIEIEIQEKDGKFSAQIKKSENNRPIHQIHNTLNAERHIDGSLKKPNGLRIMFDANKDTIIDETGVIPNPDLMTRFELKYEGKDEESNIAEIFIEKSNAVTSENVHVLRVLGEADYRARIGDREQPFYFIIENCYASIHVEEVNIGKRKLYYLVICNKSIK